MGYRNGDECFVNTVIIHCFITKPMILFTLQNYLFFRYAPIVLSQMTGYLSQMFAKMACYDLAIVGNNHIFVLSEAAYVK